MNKQNIVCFVAGKSGGHLIPALTIAQKIHEQDKYANILFFTTNSKLDQKIVQSNTFIRKWIPIPLGNIPNKK